MNTILLALILSAAAWGQTNLPLLGAGGGGGGGGGNTWTFKQQVPENNGSGVCVAVNTCAPAVAALTSGSVVFIAVSNASGSSDLLTSATAGGVSFTIPASCQIVTGTSGANSCGYLLNVTGGAVGAASITLNFGATGSYMVVISEYAPSTLGSAVLDTGSCATVSNASGVTTGAPISITGTSDLDFQWETVGAGAPTAISGAYTNLFGNTGSWQFSGFANAVNISSGAAPTWSNSATNTSVVSGCVFK